MAWIHITSEERAEGLLKEAYERIKGALGQVIPAPSPSSARR